MPFSKNVNPTTINSPAAHSPMYTGCSASRPSRLAAWFLAARPRTLSASLAPVVVGGAAAYGSGCWHAPAFTAALVGALCIQVATNFANDLFDFQKGADTADRLGPPRATQAGWLTPRQMRWGTVLAFVLAMIPGLYLVNLRGLPIALVGIFSMASGLAYTAGPWPLAYLGLGELFVFLFFGIVATAGTEFAITGSFPSLGAMAGVPLGFLAAAILAVNNLRDRATDVQAHKRTLAVRFGERFARYEYAGLLLAAYASSLLLATVGATTAAYLPWLSFPLAIATWRLFHRAHGRELNLVLGRTAALEIVFALLLSAGLGRPWA